MLLRPFGDTGLVVSALGLGAGQLGDASLDDAEAGRLLNGALDLGVTLIDTARGYGLSEERIGRHLRHRRSEMVLCTKVGYDIAGYADWTGPCITAGIDAALARLQTEVIDIVHLHSCPLDVLCREEILHALLQARSAGKIRVAAYSGDNEPLEWAAGSGHFGSVQTSLNLFDQRVIRRGLAQAQARRMGVIAKRALGNAPWRFLQQPHGNYCETYWLRMRQMGISPGDLDWEELALRFAAFVPGVSSCLTGTRSLEHLRRNAAIVERGPLPDSIVRALRAAFEPHAENWPGQI
jgi:aryl-alcohol dehydrogenase-like predicted oxidoreductase